MNAMHTYSYLIEIFNDPEATEAAATVAAVGHVPSEEELITWPSAASPALSNAIVSDVNHRINSSGYSLPVVTVIVPTELKGSELLQALGFAPGTN